LDLELHLSFENTINQLFTKYWPNGRSSLFSKKCMLPGKRELQTSRKEQFQLYSHIYRPFWLGKLKMKENDELPEMP
jgi:hypothetical protein